MRITLVLGAIATLVACNPDPGHPEEQVGYRDGVDGPNSGERGTVKITEIGWAGSVRNDGTWDPKDVFVEIRNEGNRPMRLTDWRIEMEGVTNITWRIPEHPNPINVGDYLLITAIPHEADDADSSCFMNADVVIDDMYFGMGDPFRLTLLDADERLIEPAGDRYMPPFAGVYDGQVTRSMEKVELIFGGRGSEPQSWHHYTIADVDVPNNTNIAERCRQRTLASPRRPNSPDYSGAFAAGAFD
ncbi:MAG: hypothetical protein H6737_20825 [Alphaproteobacteria bacterium]|nr:hypothetical protein [Alphaproteobacteria bacterium]